MNQGSIPIIGQKKCDLCGKQSHPFNVKCRHEDLLNRVKILLSANRSVPAMVEANKGAMVAAMEFQMISKHLTDSLNLLEETVKESWFGKRILKKWNKKVEDLWAAQTSSQDTSEAQATSNPESTTPSATQSKLSIVETPAGENTAPDSLL